MKWTRPFVKEFDNRDTEFLGSFNFIHVGLFENYDSFYALT